MLDKTIDLIVKYVILRGFWEKDPNHNFINEAIQQLSNKITLQIDEDKERQRELEIQKKRIKEKRKQLQERITEYIIQAEACEELKKYDKAIDIYNRTFVLIDKLGDAEQHNKITEKIKELEEKI